MNRYEQRLTWTCMAICLIAFGAALGQVLVAAGRTPSPSFIIQAAAFVAIILSLLYGSFVYQFTRIGALCREAKHRPSDRVDLVSRYTRGVAPSVRVLIPSYKEERRVVLQTVLSAALAEYARRDVVVLLDDPPQDYRNSASPLAQTRRMIADLHATFAEQVRRLAREESEFRVRQCSGGACPAAEALHLASLHEDVASWIERLATEFRDGSSRAFGHTDRFFLREIIDTPATRHRQRAAMLRAGRFATEELASEHAHLAGLFEVRITSFERKAFENLSHQPNKAMNLNSYIGLMGGHYRVQRAGLGKLLVSCPPQQAEMTVPSADYVLTLDADSLILNDYILRLVP